MKQLALLSFFAFCAVSSASAADVAGEFGGLDAHALSKGMDIPTDCSVKWEDTSTKKVYCFSNAAAKTAWLSDPRGNLLRAETGYRAAQMKSQAMAQANAQMKHAQEQMKQAQGMLNSQAQMQGNTPQMNQAQEAMRDAQQKMNAAQGQLGQAQGQLGQVPPK